MSGSLQPLLLLYHKSPYLKISRSPVNKMYIKNTLTEYFRDDQQKEPFIFKIPAWEQYSASDSWVDLILVLAYHEMTYLLISMTWLDSNFF